MNINKTYLTFNDLINRQLQSFFFFVDLNKTKKHKNISQN